MVHVINLPTNKGIRWSTQYFRNPSNINHMVIPSCQRCLGIIIYWKCQNKNDSYFAITAAHLSPSENRKQYRQSRNDFLKKLQAHYLFNECTLTPYLVFAAGGRIDTPKHRILYEYSLHYYVRPFIKLFPEAQVMYEEPGEDTRITNIFITSDGSLGTYQRVEIA